MKAIPAVPPRIEWRETFRNARFKRETLYRDGCETPIHLDVRYDLTRAEERDLKHERRKLESKACR